MWMWLLGIAVSLAASTPSEIPNPRQSGSWVSDTAGVIAPEQERALNALLDKMHTLHKVEVAVVTVEDVQGTPKSFTTELFNLWGVGDKDTHRGMLIVQVIQQRRLEMESGYGLESELPDGWLGTMQSRDMVPHFKSGNHGLGLLTGVQRIDHRLSGGQDVMPPPQPASRPGHRREETSKAAIRIIFLLMAMVPVTLIFMAWLKRFRQRYCWSCRVKTTLLSESEEDDHLSEGQQSEERGGQIVWDVRLCLSCRSVYVFDNTPWYRSSTKCEGCGYRTATKKRTVLKAATYSSKGLGRVACSCSHCSHRSSREYVIPVKVETTTSSTSSYSSSSSGSSGGYSSGGGGSFGGGSSGGGGAGSSW